MIHEERPIYTLQKWVLYLETNISHLSRHF